MLILIGAIAFRILPGIMLGFLFLSFVDYLLEEDADDNLLSDLNK